MNLGQGGQRRAGKCGGDSNSKTVWQHAADLLWIFLSLGAEI